jgi:hypothetical protein
LPGVCRHLTRPDFLIHHFMGHPQNEINIHKHLPMIDLTSVGMEPGGFRFIRFTPLHRSVPRSAARRLFLT